MKRSHISCVKDLTILLHFPNNLSDYLENLALPFHKVILTFNSII